ncbi:MAG: VWA domain-containing protein, partial [Gammaproteobacteria bacterium]
ARIARSGRRVHLGRTVRNSLRYGGLPLELAFRKRRRELPRLVLLLDVSRSMSLYSYLFLRFARGIVSVFRDADAFVYHTRLVRVTEALREPDIERVKEKLAVLSLGWSGGTRIGACLERFNRDYGRRVLNRRTIVVIVSDGLDTGPPALLAEHLQRIRRRVRRVIWLNPLLGRAGYEPLAGGMQAALGAVDVFASAHSLDSMRALEPYLVNG